MQITKSKCILYLVNVLAYEEKREGTMSRAADSSRVINSRYRSTNIIHPLRERLFSIRTDYF